jgi:hypothetical protein
MARPKQTDSTMGAKLTFFPTGNADCTLIDLVSGEKIIFDYANTKTDDPNDLRIDLEKAIRDDLAKAKRNDVEVFCITHLDRDHIARSSELFWLEHAATYQSDDRIKIGELWVPAAVILEDGLVDEGRIWRQEARHRLKQGKGIRVFSRPDVLKEWFKLNGLDFDERKHLFVDAGHIVPRFNLATQGVEFFAHSPFASRLDDGSLMDRNTDGIFVQATFRVNGVDTKLMLGADADYEVLTAIVDITKFHGRTERLEWDVFHLPHHCSYLSLGPEKGKDETVPVPQVKELYETYGRRRGIIVSPSCPIPTIGDEIQPPHRQAAAYYRKVVAFNGLGGDFITTMEHPKKSAPKPLVIEIDHTKARVVTAVAAGSSGLVAASAPRAGAK